MKYQSITTPKIQHDIPNFLTEIFFINKYQFLPSYAWRKGNLLAQDWPKIVAIFRKLINIHKISPEQLAWYLYKYQPKSIGTDEFGLMVWKIRKLFGKFSLKEIHSIYSTKLSTKKSNVVINDYKPLDNSSKDDLISVLDRLENKCGSEEKRS